jgi:hypothetical protein
MTKMQKLLSMRSTIGADTPAGHRISNIDEIRQNKRKTRNLERLQFLANSEARQRRDLEATGTRSLSLRRGDRQ